MSDGKREKAEAVLFLRGFVLSALTTAMAMTSVSVFAGEADEAFGERRVQSLEEQAFNEDVKALRELADRNGMVLTSEQIHQVLDNNPDLTAESLSNERFATQQQAMAAVNPAKFQVSGSALIANGAFGPTYAGGNFTNNTDMEAFANYNSEFAGIPVKRAFYGRYNNGNEVTVGILAYTGFDSYGVYGDTNQSYGLGGYFRNSYDTSTTNDYAQALYVVGDGKHVLTTEDPRSYVATVEVTNRLSASGLAVFMSGHEAGEISDYIGFITRNRADDANRLAGAIRGVHGASENGVKLVSNGADFAEFLARANPDETLESGDIVGIVQGKVSRNLNGAQHVQVISTAPIVSGNMPDPEKESLYEEVAFIGQVPVKVKGPVKAGDYIVASGNNDGVGIAIAPDNMTPENYRLAVGQAWASSSEEGVKLINTAVGLAADDVYTYMKKQDQRIKNQDQRIASLEQQLHTKMARLERLAAQMEALTQKVAYIQSNNMMVKADVK